MSTNSALTNKTNRKAVIRRVEHAVEGGGLGAVAGALIGSMTGPPGAVAGAIIGGVAGTMAGVVLDREATRRAARTRELDAEIGVSEGDMGAPNLEHPPSRRRSRASSSPRRSGVWAAECWSVPPQ